MEKSIETSQQKPESIITQEMINQNAEGHIHNFKLLKSDKPGAESVGQMIWREIRYLENAANGYNANLPTVKFPDYSPDDYLRLAKAIEELALKEGIEIKRSY